MSLTAQQIKEEAMKLTAQERADLADWLWVSAVSREEVAAAWDAEITRRIAEIDSGTAKLIPGEEVLERLEEKLRQAGV
ncbi:MAG: addiction module protein [Pseudomonadota bacterium]